MRIVDVRMFAGKYIYCGRPMPGRRNATVLANHFNANLIPTEDCIRFYDEWLSTRVIERWAPVMAALDAIKPDSVLGCWCVSMEGEDQVLSKPRKCHCQVIWSVWKQLQGKQI